MSVVSPLFLLLWAVIFLPVLVLVGWAMFNLLRHGTTPQASVKDASAQLKAANDRLKGEVSKYQRVVAALSALPEDVSPQAAERVLSAQMPGAKPQDKFDLLLREWEQNKRPQALVALAGMAFADISGTYGILDSCIRMAIDKGGPVLLDQIGQEISRRWEELERWHRTGGAVVQLERAAARIEGEAPDVAERLRRVVALIEPRTRAVMLQQLRWQIGHLEEADPGEFEVRPDAKTFVKVLGPMCLPRYPELLDEAYAALGRHEGAEWQIAQVQLIGMVMYRFADLRLMAGFDFELALSWLCAAMVSTDRAVSEAAANETASLVHDYFFDSSEMHLTLRAALETALGLHGPSASLDWLAEEIEPAEDSDARLKEAMALQEQAFAVNHGVKALAETTASTDPVIVLAELRMLLPETPVEGLRVALIARWKLEREPVCLLALVGLVTELDESVPQSRSVARLCLHWPLKDGSAGVVDAVVRLVSERFERLDQWIYEEGSVLDMGAAGRRLAQSSPDVAARVTDLLARVKGRRVVLLEQSIARRLEAAEAEGEQVDLFQLVLDVYRWCLPAHPELGAKARLYLGRRDAVPARKARLWFESMIVKHFAPIGWLEGYDVDALVGLLHDGIADYDFAVAGMAASIARDMVDSGTITTWPHIADLQGALEWADNLHPERPESFAALRQAMTDAWARGGVVVSDAQ